MAKSIFFKLILCENCNQNYKRISERKKFAYICSGYSRGLPDSCKTRYSIKEEDLLYIVQIYCNRNKIELIRTYEFMKSVVNRISVNNKDKGIIIEYKNGEQGIYTLNEIHI